MRSSMPGNPYGAQPTQPSTAQVAPHGPGNVEQALSTLTTLVGELEEARARAADDAMRLLINYAALAPYANPERLPPFRRLIVKRGDDPRSNPRYPINNKPLPARPIRVQVMRSYLD